MHKGKTKAARRPSKKRGSGAKAKENGATGTYIVDKATGRLVKISSSIPSLVKSANGDLGGSDDISGCGDADLE